ncbi:MAG: DUF3429 domain-containing protein [Halothiobacillaceae bacterium]
MVIKGSRQPSLVFQARLAGFAGLIPFVAPLLLLWWQGQWAAEAIFVQHAYAALILSFLGGIYWGVALARQSAGWIWISVLPSLWAWPALVMPPVAAAWILAAGFALMFLIDRAARQRGWIELWFYQLRLVLGLVAIVSLLLGLVG